MWRRLAKAAPRGIQRGWVHPATDFDRGELPGSWFGDRAELRSLFQAAQAPPLAFGLRLAEHLHMTPRAQKMNPTAGAVRASQAIQQNAALLKSLPEIIDHETGVREILEILQSIVEQAGDLVESRSPELLAAARAALARYHDEALAEAE